MRIKSELLRWLAGTILVLILVEIVTLLMFVFSGYEYIGNGLNYGDILFHGVIWGIIIRIPNDAGWVWVLLLMLFPAVGLGGGAGELFAPRPKKKKRIKKKIVNS